MKKCYKHNIVKTKLDKCSWIDTDTRMLHAIMELVTEFVNTDMHKWSLKDFKKECARIEKEDDKEYAKDNLKRMIHQYKTDQKIISIAKWWKNYDNRIKDIDRARDSWTSYYKKFIEDKEEFLGFQNARDQMNKKQKDKEHSLFLKIKDLEKKLYEEEQSMLKMAVDIRGAMWS